MSRHPAKPVIDISKKISPRAGNADEAFSNTLFAIVDAAEIGLWDWHLPSGKVIYNRQWERIAGYEEGELSQDVRAWENAVFPGDLEHAQACIARYLSGEVERYEAEFRMLRKDGRIIWAQDKGRIVEYAEDGTPLRLIGVLQDVTRLKVTEKHLKETSEQLEFVARTADMATWIYDIASDSMCFRDDYLVMTGSTRKENYSTLDVWKDHIHPDDRQEAMRLLRIFMWGESDQYTSEMRILHKDGHYIWTMLAIHVSKWDKSGLPQGLLGSHMIIDNLKKTEQNLQQALRQNEQYNERLKDEVERAIESLEESRRISQAMFEANPYVNLLFNTSFSLIDCNPAAIEYFGFSSREELLQNASALITSFVPEYQPGGQRSASLLERLKYTIEHGFIDFETELNINNAPVPMRIVMKRITYFDQCTIALYLIDLRQLKEAKNELQRQDRLLIEVNTIATRLMASSPESFDIDSKQSLKTLCECVSADHVFIFRNDEQENAEFCYIICEWKREDLPPDSIQTVPTLRFASYPNWYIRLSTGCTINETVARLPDPEGETLRLLGIQSIMIQPLFLEGRFWGFIGFSDYFRERTLRVSEENILRSGGVLIMSAILRDASMRDLIAAKEIAQQNAHAKSQFLANMSHEIRTPMNAIIGMNAIAKKSDDIARVHYCLDKIDSASHQLLSIINDVLDMSKIEANKLEIVNREFDFTRMIHHIFNVITVRMEEKKQHFAFDLQNMPSRMVIGDELRLSQVITNLLTNAVKFTPNNGNILLSVQQVALAEDRVQLRVEVRDDGIGISPEQVQRLFRSFEQADGSITRRFGGTGLGLAICKTIVSLMGGQIWVESTQGNGSTFIFEVEIMLGGESKTLQPSFAGPRRSTRILVVDDQDEVLLYFNTILSSFSMHCDNALSGTEAIEMVRQAFLSGAPYELAFIDWKMPGLDGLQTAREITRITGGSTAIVLISAGDLSEIQVESAQAGVRLSLPKPIAPSMLFNSIMELTDRAALPVNIAEPSTRIDWSSHKILLAEDIEINREILISILSDTGISIDWAVNGAQAVEFFTNAPETYSLILMDVQMPKLDGLAATRKIRASDAKNANSVPIIAMTANAFKEDVADCLAAGMNNHVAKPVDIDDLLAKLSSYLQGS